VATVAQTFKASDSTEPSFNSMSVYLDICIGNRDEYATAQAAYNSTCSLLSNNAKIYGLPSSLADLSEEQRDILRDLDVHTYLLSTNFVTRFNTEHLEIHLSAVLASSAPLRRSARIRTGCLSWTIENDHELRRTMYRRERDVQECAE
jgi:hypothetical protein